MYILGFLSQKLGKDWLLFCPFLLSHLENKTAPALSYVCVYVHVCLYGEMPRDLAAVTLN